MRSHSRRGNLLAMTLSLIVVLVTLVAALHHYEQVSRRGYLGAEAHLQLVLSRRWELGKAMRKLPVNVNPTVSLLVSAGTRATANGTVIPDNSGSKLFDSGSDSVWNGLPDLLVNRSDTVLEPPPPPAATEYQDQPISSSSALSVFSGRRYRHTVSSLAPYAAYAPLGSINLDKVVGWSNPPMIIDDPALELYSGQPTVVAAGGNVNIADFPYGTVYSKNESDENPIRVGAGMALPLISNFPVRPFESDLATNISTHQASLTRTASARGNKTTFISGEPPGPEDLLSMMLPPFTPPDLSAWLSLRSSLQWKCPTIPGFTTVAVPLTYVAFAFWFHAPYPPDSVETGTADPYEQLERYYNQLDALVRKRKLAERRIRQLEGGPELAGNAANHIPSQPAVVGLIPRSTAVKAALAADIAALSRTDARQRSANAARLNVQTNTALLTWLADYGPDGVLTDPSNRPSRSEAYAQPTPHRMSLIPATPTEIANQRANRILDQTQVVFPTLTEGGIDVSRHPTPRWDGQDLNREAPTSLSKANWDKLLIAKIGGDQFLANEEDQLSLLKWLNDDTNAQNPFAKANKWLTDSKTELEDVKGQIDALDGEGGTIATFLANLASAADADPSLRLRSQEVRTNGRRAPPYSHSRYGYSFDLLFNLIIDGVNGNLQKRWQPTHPLVWFGPPDTNQAGAIQATARSFTMRATLTVPQARTFCYDHRMNIIGDLWLQRGSTMVVRGDLSLQRVETSIPTDASKYNFFTPSGRLIMEEGSVLIVEGNFRCEGTLERGSVILTATPKQIHPVNSALLVNGDITIPYGIYNGLGITDILPVLGSVGAGMNTVVSPVLSTLGPNVAKLMGPFHRRFCFFSQRCTEYQLEVFIGPFGIPIPVMHPWVGLRKNVWVTIYRGLALFYSVVDNLNMGEYLYPQCDWWPLGHKDGVGMVPVIPKLDPNSLVNAVESVSVQLPSADDIGQLIVDYWPELFRTVQDDLLKGILTSLASSMVPYAPPGVMDSILSPLFDALGASESALTSDDPTELLVRTLLQPLTRFKDRVTDRLRNFGEDVLMDSLAHEVAGVLMKGNTIKIGMNSSGMATSPAPFMAAGMFFANGDIDINARHTMGTIMSATGSINHPSRGAHTRLLFYPLYSRCGLYMPTASPAIENRSPLSGFSGGLTFIRNAGNYEYGRFGDRGTGLDVGVPVTRVTAEGWQ